jgi:hypothetical protein
MMNGSPHSSTKPTFKGNVSLVWEHAPTMRPYMYLRSRGDIQIHVFIHTCSQQARHAHSFKALIFCETSFCRFLSLLGYITDALHNTCSLHFAPFPEPHQCWLLALTIESNRERNPPKFPSYRSLATTSPAGLINKQSQGSESRRLRNVTAAVNALAGRLTSSLRLPLVPDRLGGFRLELCAWRRIFWGDVRLRELLARACSAARARSLQPRSIRHPWKRSLPPRQSAQRPCPQSAAQPCCQSVQPYMKGCRY